MKFFVTGATGFVGAHLVKTLIERGEEVTALLNQSSELTVPEQSQKSLRTLKLDLLDTDQMATALIGHDVVVHLAYGSRGTPEEQRQVTVEGTKSMLESAARAGIRRFVHMSTASTYGEPPTDKVYTENAPRLASLEHYVGLKQEAEKAAIEASSAAFETVVLQPSIIYGPGRGYWTGGILKELSKRFLPLVDGGKGLCNLIHLYDVVDAIILAATVPGIGSGECFILANDEPVTWARLLKSYESILGERCLLVLPAQLLKKYNIWRKYQRKIPEYKFYAKAVKALLKLLQFPHTRKSVKIPNNERIDFFLAKPRFSNQKAKKALGFTPKIGFDAGICTIKEWVEKGELLRSLK